MLFSRSKSLTPSDAAAAVARGELQLIDVRESSELTEARVKDATHIPLGQLPAKLSELTATVPSRSCAGREAAARSPLVPPRRPGLTPRTSRAA